MEPRFSSIEWDLLQYPVHSGVQNLVRDLNRVYREIPALHERDCESSGFEWIVSDDSDNSVIAWVRKGEKEGDIAVVVSNFTPVPRPGYRIGVPHGGYLPRGAEQSMRVFMAVPTLGNAGGVNAEEMESHGRPYSLDLTLPPLSTLIFERKGG